MTGPICPKRLRWLLEHHATALELYARQFCRCTEDVVQEAVIELAAQRELPQDDVAWLYGVVRHKAISAAQSDTAASSGKTGWPKVERRAFRLSRTGGRGAAGRRALESLPQQQRELVVAHIWGGLTFEQIGHLMGISGSTAIDNTMSRWPPSARG